MGFSADAAAPIDVEFELGRLAAGISAAAMPCKAKPTKPAEARTPIENFARCMAGDIMLLPLFHLVFCKAAGAYPAETHLQNYVRRILSSRPPPKLRQSYHKSMSMRERPEADSNRAACMLRRIKLLAAVIR